MDTTTNNELPPHLRVNPFAPKTPPQPPVEPRSTTTRRGKIGRLPRAIRETLNQRLADGEIARTLLAWLNARPEVKSVLAEHFEGRAITEQNLSEWRQGGYVDWEHKELLRESLSDLREEFDALEIGDSEQSLADRCAELQALALSRLLIAVLAEPASERREQRILALVRSLNSVRRCDHDRERVRLQRERQNPEPREQLTPEEEEARIRTEARLNAFRTAVVWEESDLASTARREGRLHGHFIRNAPPSDSSSSKKSGNPQR